MANELIVYKIKQDEYAFIRNKYKDLPPWIIKLSELVKESLDEEQSAAQ